MVDRPKHIAVIGGGFTGAAFVIHATRHLRGPLDFTVIEPSAEIGRGVAYAARDPRHRINVPSDRMSLFPEDRDHATRWFFAEGLLPGDGSSTDAAGQHYVPRWGYGAYVADVLAQTLASAGPRVRLRHHRALAEDVRQLDGRWSVSLAGGGLIEADRIVLSFGHARPRPPFPVSPAASGDPRFVADAWQSEALAPIALDADVLLIGTGLTMADMAETLLTRGHRGPITAVSRRGLLALPQGLFKDDFDWLQDAQLPSTALQMLQLARKGARAATAKGLGWQPAADALRFSLGRIWPALPPEERKRVVRRLLPFWEVHRFRVAPQPDATLKSAIGTGRVIVERAGVLSVETEGRSLAVTFRHPGGSTQKRLFGGVVLCIGPDRDLRQHPLARNLLASGLARLDVVGLGLEVDHQSRLVSRDGRVHADLLALGPMTRGSFGEMTGAPDITRHVAEIVKHLPAAD